MNHKYNKITPSMKWSKKLGLLLLHLPTSGTRIRLQARRQGKETEREIVAGSQLGGSVPSITHSFSQMPIRQSPIGEKIVGEVCTLTHTRYTNIQQAVNYTKYAHRTSELSVCAKSATGLLILQLTKFTGNGQSLVSNSQHFHFF